jgi:hypothetical protein
MGDRSRISREGIIDALVGAIEPLDYVYAMWEGGAMAFDRVDEWSDIDVLVDAEDERVTDVFPVAEKALEALSPIDLKYEITQPTLGDYVQAFYRLRNASEFLLIDLAIFPHSAPDKLLEPEIHGNARFHFNKGDAVKIPALDRSGLIGKIEVRIGRLRQRFDMFNCFVQKEINRSNPIEALELYRRLTLESLVEVLRMRYEPARYDFKTRYVYHDLPAEVAGKLEDLYFVRDMNDLEAKYRAAEEWFRRELGDIDTEAIAEVLKAN